MVAIIVPGRYGPMIVGGTGGAAAWTPASLGANLTAWYLADTGVYKDAGSTLAANNETVQQWNDQSGNAHHLSQATSGNRPTYKTASDYNTQKGIDFVAASSNFMTTPSQVIPSNNTTISAFIVGRMRTGTSNYGRALSWTTSASLSIDDYANTTSAALILRDAGVNGFSTYFNGGALQIQSISLATNYRLGVIFDGSNAKTYINGSGSAGTGAVPNFGANGALRAGGEFSGGGAPSSFWDGPILEVVIAKTSIASDVSNIETYFTNKWGS